MPYPFYNLVHLFGIFLVIAGLAALCVHAANGGTKRDKRTYRLGVIMHGLGLLVVLVGGFGMLARLGLTEGLPGWIWAKLAIWLVIGALLMVPYRAPRLARPLAVLLPFVALLAGYLAIYKPF